MILVLWSLDGIADVMIGVASLVSAIAALAAAVHAKHTRKVVARQGPGNHGARIPRK